MEQQSKANFQKIKMTCKCPTIIKEKNFTKARELIKREKEKEKKVIFVSNNDEITRKILAKSPPNILVILQSKRKDYQKQRNSGFNQVLANIAKKKKVTIGICLDEIQKAKSLKEKAKILARVKQNIKLCNKTKLKMKFCGKSVEKKKKKDLQSLGLSLGMPTNMVKNLF